MKIKLYQGFAFVAIASAIFAFVRLGFGEDPDKVIPLNIVVGGVCFVMMMIFIYKERRQIARRN